jgi:hypothetical protein
MNALVLPNIMQTLHKTTWVSKNTRNAVDDIIPRLAGDKAEGVDWARKKRRESVDATARLE